MLRRLSNPFCYRRSAAFAAASTTTTAAAARRWYSNYDNNLAQDSSGGRRPGGGASGGGGGAMGHITKSHVWGLWNEGNLFSLSVPELTHFLSTECQQQVDAGAKKSALVRKVEELMSVEQPQMTNAAASPPIGGGAAGAAPFDPLQATVAEMSQDGAYGAQGVELYDEADVYGDWGIEPNFEQKRALDYIEVSAAGLISTGVPEPLAVRSYQLLHTSGTGDVGLSKINPSKIPGCGHLTEAYALKPVTPQEANKARFRKGLQWAVTNMWNMNCNGEINVGAGKVLFWRQASARTVLPIWTLQQTFQTTHPYSYFAVATDSNVLSAESFAQQLGMTLSQDAETSYKIQIKRSRDCLDLELNSELRPTLVQFPWDRFFCAHTIRDQMPDLRFLIRARQPIKKRIAEPYENAQVIQLTRDSVQPVLAADLGDVQFACERVMRKWSTQLSDGVTLKLVETKRTPLIIHRAGEEGERLEYELIASIPPQSSRPDLGAFADTMWEKGEQLAAVLEDGMQELQAHTMPSSAAFDAAFVPS